MTFEQAIQLLTVIAGAFSAWRSASSGTRKVLDKLATYVTVTEYREKTAGLHAEINELRTRLAIYEDRAKR